MVKAELPLVSIGIPAYKPAFLSRAIGSALGQTYGNIEVIVVDDCSPHNIKGIVDKYSDGRVHYYVNKKNVGADDPGNNWNECLRRARGEYFCLLCDDDAYEPTFVEELLGLAAKYPDCDVFHSSVKVYDTGDNVIQVFPKSPEWESCADYIINTSRRRRKQTVSEWMYRRETMVALGGYDNVPLAWGSDCLSVMKFAAKGGIASTDKELAVFRRSGENISMVRQGQCVTKVHGTFVYITKLTALVDGDATLSVAVPRKCIEQIRRNENRAILAHASFREFMAIMKMRKEYGVALSSAVKAIIVRTIKAIIGLK